MGNYIGNTVNVNSFNENNPAAAQYGFSPADIENILDFLPIKMLIKIINIINDMGNEIFKIKDAIVDFVNKLTDIINGKAQSTYGIKDTVADLVLKTLIPVLEGSLDFIMSCIEKLLDIVTLAIKGVTGTDSIREGLKKYLDAFLDGYYTKVLEMLRQLLDLIDPSAPGPDVDDIKKLVIDMVREALEVIIKKMKERIAGKLIPGQ